MRLARHSYSTLRSIQGPLVFVEKVLEARMGEVVSILFPDGRETEGEVLRIENDTVLIQVVGDSRGLDMDRTRIVFTACSAARSGRSTTSRCSCRSAGRRSPACP
jgi:vacuolar-type H+-ATPase subunit B/Vma2